MRNRLKNAAQWFSGRKRSSDSANSEEIERRSSYLEGAEQRADGEIAPAAEGAAHATVEGDLDPAADEKAERLFHRIGMRGLSATMLDHFADCPKRFEFALSGREQMDIPSVGSAINERVNGTLHKFMGLDPSERTHAAIEPALRLARLEVKKNRVFSEDDQDFIVTEVRRILHRFIDSHDVSRSTTARMLPLYAEVPSPHGQPIPVEVVIESVQVCGNGESIQLVTYDLGDPGQYKHPIESDPMMCAWLVAAADSLRQPVSEIQNIFVKHDLVERWQVLEGDVEKARDVLARVVEQIRWSVDLEATPGAWCGYCGYAAACPSAEFILTGEARIRNGIF